MHATVSLNNPFGYKNMLSVFMPCDPILENRWAPLIKILHNHFLQDTYKNYSVKSRLYRSFYICLLLLQAIVLLFRQCSTLQN